VSAPGDVWLLGPHRAQVGDSTLAHAVEHLMRKDRADLFFSDPPFGMDYAGGRGKANFGTAHNDDIPGAQFPCFLQKALSCAVMYKKPGAAGYVCFTWRTYDDFRSVLASSGLEPAACIVWDKQYFGLGHAHYRPQHEFIFYWPGDAWYGA